MMKKLETQSDKESKQRRLRIIIGVIIVALMVFSSLGYAIIQQDSGSSENKYGNYKFVQTSTGWQVNLKDYGKTLYTNYLPQEVLNFSGNGTDLYYYNSKKAYVVISSQQDAQLSSEILTNINDVVSRIQFACSYENENSSFCQETNLPLKDCSDAGYEVVVFKINSSSNIASYNYNQGCLILNGQGNDFIRMSDNFLFKLFKVI
jgi:hypothetical protein